LDAGDQQKETLLLMSYLAAPIDLQKYKQFIVQVHTDQKVRYADAKIAVILWESFNWRQGVCYAGFKEVLKRTGLHRASVYDGLGRLLERGHIGYVGDCQELGHARFRLIVKDVVSSVSDKVSSVGDKVSSVGDTDSPKIAPNDLEPIGEPPVGGNPYLNLLPESLHTLLPAETGVCEQGKDKKEKPTPDTSDDDFNDLEYFRQVAGCPSPDGGDGVGHNLSPVTDLDHAVTTVLAAFANHPYQVSRPDVIRREMAKVLEKIPLDVFMAVLIYHQTDVWPSKKYRFIPTPENFLIDGTWEKTPIPVLDAAKEAHRRRQQDHQESPIEDQPSPDQSDDQWTSRPENWDEVSAQFTQYDGGGW
jgi:hypothetical protein